MAPREPDEIDVLEAEARLSGMLRERLVPIMNTIAPMLPAGAEFLLAVDLTPVSKTVGTVVTISTDRKQFIEPMRQWIEKAEREGGEG